MKEGKRPCYPEVHKQITSDGFKPGRVSHCLHPSIKHLLLYLEGKGRMMKRETNR